MNPSGNGLGLYISRKICRGLGGNLVVQSKKGYGAIFTMTQNVKIAKENEITKKETKTPEKEKPIEVIFTDSFLKELNESKLLKSLEESKILKNLTPKHQNNAIQIVIEEQKDEEDSIDLSFK